MKIYNSFGIKPTNTYVSAGSDYYIPNIDTEEKKERALKAFEKSYKKTTYEINEIYDIIYNIIEDTHIDQSQVTNLVHLYLAFYNPVIEALDKLEDNIDYFIKQHVLYDEKKKVVGLKMDLNDTLFINSGIKIALDTVLSDHVAPNSSATVNDLRLLDIGVAGLYVNKSGNGNKGWDVRSVLVDEDYSGFVHLSLAYTKDLITQGENYIYCGDKLVQMILLPVFHTQYEEISEKEYNKLMQNSLRGSNGFGSSDIKH